MTGDKNKVETYFQRVTHCRCLRCGKLYGEYKPNKFDSEYCPECREWKYRSNEIISKLVDKIIYLEDNGYLWDVVKIKKH